MVKLCINISYLGYLVSTCHAPWPMELVFMSTFDNQSMSIGCVGKLGHLFGFLRHDLLKVNRKKILSIHDMKFAAFSGQMTVPVYCMHRSPAIMLAICPQ